MGGVRQPVGPLLHDRRTTYMWRRKGDMDVLRELIEAGKVTPVIDGTYPLSEAAEAMRYFQDGHPGVKVVITV